MDVIEIRDPAEVRSFLAQGLWLQRVLEPNAASVGPALRWTLELSGAGEPMPPVGVVADVGHLVFGHGRDLGPQRAAPEVPGWPDGLVRSYEDHVLGRLDADGTMARAADALARYRGRDRDRGLAFVIGQLQRRSGAPGVLLNPAAVKGALEAPADAFLDGGWELLARDGPMPVLVTLHEGFVAAARDLHEAIGPEDVFELEHGTALAAFSQRVALRQVVQAAAEFEARLGRDRPRANPRHRDVATRFLDEDTYPVGGFSSITNRGSIESLLHSELAYMEIDERPDLFDIKYARDELLYYGRDENQFLRRRRSFLIALTPDLVSTRVKDVELPRQRIVLLLAMLAALVRRFTDWLSDEALTFEFLFVCQKDGIEPLAPDRALIEMLLREPIAHGTVVVGTIPEDGFAPRCLERSRRTLCHALAVSTTDRPVDAGGVPLVRLLLDGPRPSILGDGAPPTTSEAEDALEGWHAALERLRDLWA